LVFAKLAFMDGFIIPAVLRLSIAPQWYSARIENGAHRLSEIH
jgi:hypothetical protein